MSHFKIFISQDDAESLLKGAMPSQDVLASVYREVYKRQLQQFNSDELRDEIERVIEPEIIADMFFGHTLGNNTYDRSMLIEILADIAFDAYEFKPTPNQ